MFQLVFAFLARYARPYLPFYILGGFFLGATAYATVRIPILIGETLNLIVEPGPTALLDAQATALALMLWGVNDLALTVETTFATHRYVRDLTLRYLPEASHFVQQDAPGLVNRLLCAYLRGEPVPEEGEAEGGRVTTRV